MSRQHEGQKIIIFDGPDGCGKTNIARAMSDRYGVPYFKFSGEADYWREGKFKTALEFDQSFMIQHFEQSHADLIWDRAWPSEWVYSRVFGRETNEKLLSELDHRYAALHTWIIVPMKRNYIDNVPDLLVKPEDLNKIHATYDDFCDWTHCNTIRLYVDSLDNDLKRELEAIDASIRYGSPFHHKITVEDM